MTNGPWRHQGREPHRGVGPEGHLEAQVLRPGGPVAPSSRSHSSQSEREGAGAPPSFVGVATAPMARPYWEGDSISHTHHHHQAVSAGAVGGWSGGALHDLPWLSSPPAAAAPSSYASHAQFTDPYHPLDSRHHHQPPQAPYLHASHSASANLPVPPLPQSSTSFTGATRELWLQERRPQTTYTTTYEPFRQESKPWPTPVDVQLPETFPYPPGFLPPPPMFPTAASTSQPLPPPPASRMTTHQQQQQQQQQGQNVNHDWVFAGDQPHHHSGASTMSPPAPPPIFRSSAGGPPASGAIASFGSAPMMGDNADHRYAPPPDHQQAPPLCAHHSSSHHHYHSSSSDQRRHGGGASQQRTSRAQQRHMKDLMDHAKQRFSSRSVSRDPSTDGEDGPSHSSHHRRGNMGSHPPPHSYATTTRGGGGGNPVPQRRRLTQEDVARLREERENRINARRLFIPPTSPRTATSKGSKSHALNTTTHTTTMHRRGIEQHSQQTQEQHLEPKPAQRAHSTQTPAEPTTGRRKIGITLTALKGDAPQLSQVMKRGGGTTTLVQDSRAPMSRSHGNARPSSTSHLDQHPYYSPPRRPVVSATDSDVSGGEGREDNNVPRHVIVGASSHKQYKEAARHDPKAAEYLRSIEQLYHDLRHSYDDFRRHPEKYLKGPSAAAIEKVVHAASPLRGAMEAAAASTSALLPAASPIAKVREDEQDTTSFSVRHPQQQSQLNNHHSNSHHSAAYALSRTSNFAADASSSTSAEARALRQELARLESQWQRLSDMNETAASSAAATGGGAMTGTGSSRYAGSTGESAAAPFEVSSAPGGGGSRVVDPLNPSAMRSLVRERKQEISLTEGRPSYSFGL